jgi:hypothetical protein
MHTVRPFCVRQSSVPAVTTTAASKTHIPTITTAATARIRLNLTLIFINTRTRLTSQSRGAGEEARSGEVSAASVVQIVTSQPIIASSARN